MTPGGAPSLLRVLVVEDNADAADIMAELIKRRGHEVQIAHDGETGLSAARAFRPQVILLDIGLPDTDGYAVAQRLREEHLTGELLIALTGYGEAEDRERAKKAGFDRHLTKPVDPDALLALFESARRTPPGTP